MFVAVAVGDDVAVGGGVSVLVDDGVGVCVGVSVTVDVAVGVGVGVGGQYWITSLGRSLTSG